MFTQKTTKYGSTYKVLGKYISLVEIQCNLPIEALIEHQYTTYVVKGYTVAIGHSRSYFSPQSLKYFEFDSKCQMAKGTEERRYFETVVSIIQHKKRFMCLIWICLIMLLYYTNGLGIIMSVLADPTIFVQLTNIQGYYLLWCLSTIIE